MSENEKRIVLIEPPFYRLYKSNFSLDRYPIGLGYLASVIKQKTDWNVKVFNMDFSAKSEILTIQYLCGKGFNNFQNNLKDLNADIWSEMTNMLAIYNPSVIGISTKSQNFTSTTNIAKIVKDFNNDILVVIGGCHPSMVGENILKDPNIDVIIFGEGEETIVELLNNNCKANNIDGVAYKNGSKIIKNKKRAYITDLDSLPFPHKYAKKVLINYEKYPITAFRFIFAIRGCPFNCFFCGSKKVWGGIVRFRSVSNVVDQMISLRDFGLRYVHFDDDTFGVNKEYIVNLCNEIISRNVGLKWSCEFHVKLVDDHTIGLMKRAGCVSIQIGIESGNNDMLRLIKKNITVEESIIACKVIKDHGIELQGFFIVGFPWETEKTLADTVSLMKKVTFDNLIYSIFTPYPGTEIFDYCKQKGLVGNDFDVSLYNHQSPKNNFCMNISDDRFRYLANNIEKICDKVNQSNRVKSLFSVYAIDKIRELGFRECVKKGIKILIGK